MLKMGRINYSNLQASSFQENQNVLEKSDTPTDFEEHTEPTCLHDLRLLNKYDKLNYLWKHHLPL